MGANEWRTGDAWPLPETQWTKILRLTLAPSPTVDDIYRRLSSVFAERIANKATADDTIHSTRKLTAVQFYGERVSSTPRQWPNLDPV